MTKGNIDGALRIDIYIHRKNDAVTGLGRVETSIDTCRKPYVIFDCDTRIYEPRYFITIVI